MRNYHIVGMVFFAGVIITAAILPAHALPVSLNRTVTETVIESVDDETDVITLENGTYFDVSEDDLELFSQGDSVQVINDDGVTTLYDTSNGNQAFAN